MSAGKSRQPSSSPGKLSLLALRAQPDARLVGLAREGHEAAFEEIVRRYRAPLVRFASTIVPADAAEDAVQEGLIRAHEAMLADDSELALRAWLYTIVRNGAVSQRRRIRPTEELDETINGVPQPPDIFERREQVRGVIAKLKELPEAQREALVQTELGGESADRIAASLGTTPAAVGQLVFRARSALRSGAALVLPLPLMRALLELGASRGGGATAGGVAAGALAGGGGGGTVVKVGTVLVVAAVAVGPGRAPVIDIERPPAVEAGAAGGEKRSSTGSAAHQSAAEPAATRAEDSSSRSEGGDDRPTGTAGGQGDESIVGGGGETISVELASSSPSDGGSGAGAPPDDGDHHGGEAPPQEGGDGEHSDGSPPPPPPDDGAPEQGGHAGGGGPGPGPGGDDSHDGAETYGHPDGGGDSYGDGYGGGGSGGDHGGD